MREVAVGEGGIRHINIEPVHNCGPIRRPGADKDNCVWGITVVVIHINLVIFYNP